MRCFMSSLVVALLFGLGFSAQAQTDKKPEKKPSSVVLWEEYEKQEKHTAKARVELAKAIDALKATRTKAEKAPYKALCDEIFTTAQKQRETIRKAQDAVTDAEKKDLQVLIDVLRKMPAAIDKDVASGAFDAVPAVKEQMQKLANEGRGLDVIPKETVDRELDQMFMLKRLQSSVTHISFSTKEAGCGVVLVGYSITRPIGQKEGEETKEMTEARNLYIKYLGEAIDASEQLAARPVVPKVSPK